MSIGFHAPVMLREAVELIAVRPGGRYIDGTLGRAGHSSEIARRGGVVLGIDRDDDALREVASLGLENLKPVKGCHGDIARIAAENGWESVNGILLDLGTSSPQLDEAGRGFSFLRSGPLDMRMDRSQLLTASEVVNTWSVERLEEVFRTLGEEPKARKFAKAIVAEREPRPFETTKALAEFIERIEGRRSARHPATRLFQALRMVVNDEIGELKRALADGVRLLAPGGRFVVITFESLTDRIVKQFFALHIGRKVSLQAGGERWEGEVPRANAVTRKALKPSEEEVAENPRARSAKLRAIEIAPEQAAAA